jgi:hypothetical protein
MVVCRRLQDEAGARPVMAQLDALDNLGQQERALGIRQGSRQVLRSAQ